MIIIPAIDLKDGKCVRLLQGDYEQITQYSDSPVAQAEEWQNCGAEIIHIVDLDGAKDGVSKNLNQIKSIIKKISIPIEVGGGIRSIDAVKSLLDIGVKYVIIGTAAVKDRKFLENCLMSFSESITVGLDARDNFIAVDGWLNTTSLDYIDFARDICALGCKRIIYTDIARDGMLTSPNFINTAKLADAVLKFGCSVVASGGVGSIDDLLKLKKLNRPNIEGVIAGKALYEKKFNLRAAIEILNNKY